jgi:glycosyltransferase involved in cell wall biosynthesis
MDSKKVLFVSHSSELYGAERSLLVLVTQLQIKWGIKPVVLLPRDGELLKKLEDSRIETIVTPYYRWITKKERLPVAWVRTLQNYVQVRRLSPVLQKIKPDVIYTNTLASPIGALLAQTYGIPHIWHAREFVHEDMHWVYALGVKSSMSLMSRSTKLIICNSEAVRRKIAKYIPIEKCAVVYNGFEFSDEIEFNSAKKYENVVHNNRPVRIIIVSQLYPNKGQMDAIQALSVLKERQMSIELLIVGSGEDSYVAELKKLANQLNVGRQVVFKGYIKDPKQLIADSAVCLVCSRSEAFGRSAVEAMAIGIPVVGTNSGGLPEIVQDGITGLLYEPGDYKGLAYQVERLLNDRLLYERIASQSFNSVRQRFNTKQYVDSVARYIFSM